MASSRACGRFPAIDAQILEEGHVVRNGCCGRAAPTRIFEIEMDQAGHVIPAARDLARGCGREDSRQTLPSDTQGDAIRPAPCTGCVCGSPLSANHLEKVAPPKSFVSRFGFRDVDAQRMFQRAEIHVIGHHRDVESDAGISSPDRTPAWWMCKPLGRVK